MAVSVKRDGDKLRLYTPYDSSFIAGVKQIGGKWVSGYSAWVVDARNEDLARNLLRKVFLTDGEPGPTVTLYVTLDNIYRTFASGIGDQLLVGPVEALRKTSRDKTPTVGEGCVIVAGALKAYGGSARYPAITYEEGTILRIDDFPREAAEKLVEDNPKAYRFEEPAIEVGFRYTREEALTGSLNVIEMLRSMPIVGDKEQYLELLDTLNVWVKVLGEDDGATDS